MTNSLSPPGLSLYRRRPSRIYREGPGGRGPRRGCPGPTPHRRPPRNKSGRRAAAKGKEKGKKNQCGAREQRERPRTHRQTDRHLRTERHRTARRGTERGLLRRSAPQGAGPRPEGGLGSPAHRPGGRPDRIPRPSLPPRRPSASVGNRRRHTREPLPGLNPAAPPLPRGQARSAAAPPPCPPRSPCPPLRARVCGERASGSSAQEKREREAHAQVRMWHSSQPQAGCGLRALRQSEAGEAPAAPLPPPPRGALAAAPLLATCPPRGHGSAPRMRAARGAERSGLRLRGAPPSSRRREQPLSAQPITTQKCLA